MVINFCDILIVMSKSYYQEYYQNHREERRRSSKKYYDRHRKKANDKAIAHYYKNRLKIMSNKYNINEAELALMFEKQENKCRICHQKRKLCVDHCHTTGKVRGLICNSCNHGLGFFEDNPDFLVSATRYLLESKKSI